MKIRSFAVRICRATIVLLAVFALTARLGADAARTWTSKDGTESVVGEFAGFDGQVVSIRTVDGETIRVPLRNLGNDDLQFVRGAMAKPGAAGDPVDFGVFGEKLRGKLVDERGREYDVMKDRTDAPEYYILYYSASWCGPCRAFTPDLVRFYDRTRKSRPEIEVVLVSSDKSEAEALKYQKDYRMRFPAVRFGEHRSADIPGNPSGGIPALRMVDKEGNTVLTSVDVGRGQFLEQAAGLAE